MTDPLPFALELSSLNQRLQLATVDAELNHQVMSFPDVCTALLKNDCTMVGNKSQPLGSVGLQLMNIVQKFARISKLVVQTNLSADEWRQVFSMHLKKLYLSTENLKILNELTIELKTESLKSLYVLYRIDQGLRFIPYFKINVLESFVCPSLSRICLTGVKLGKKVIIRLFSLPNLKSLDLIGTVVLSEGMTSLQQSLQLSHNLEEVSLPPSWFSFSTAESYPSGVEAHSFSKWKLHKICLYVHLYDEDLFWKQLNLHLPADLQTLVLYGNTARITSCEEIKSWEKFGILFGPKESQLLNLFGCGVTKLVSHHVKVPFLSSNLASWMVKKKKKTVGSTSQTTNGRTTINNRSRPRRRSASEAVRRISRRMRTRPHHNQNIAENWSDNSDSSDTIDSNRSDAGNEEQRTDATNSDSMRAQVGSAASNRSSPQQVLPLEQPPNQPATAEPNQQPSDEEEINAVVEVILASVARQMEEFN